MLSEQLAGELTRRWQSTLQGIIRQAATAKTRAWNGLGSWDEVDVERFDRAARLIDEAAKRAVVSATDAYYSTLMETAPAGLEPDQVGTVRPDPRAPFTTVWHHLSIGDDFTVALDAGRSTVENDLTTHLIDSSRATGDPWARAAGIEDRLRWRRVLTGESCEWCALVSTQWYLSAGSATFGHRACDCYVVPIDIDTPNISGVIDRGLAKRLRDAGVTDRITDRQRPKRSERAAVNAEHRRDRTLDEMRAERDPARRRRLEERARRWDADAKKYRARAAEEAAHARDLPSGTGYVDTFGRPVPRP